MINKFSIIIVTWNTARITEKCVKTINKYLPGQEIIVIDNDSQDNTIELLSKYENVKIIKNDSNLGFAKANNIGFRQANSDYVLFMNSDIELIDKSLLKMINYLDKHRNIGIIGPKFLNPDKSPQASVFPPQIINNAFKEFWLGQKTYSKYIPTNKKAVKVNAISGGCLAVNKDLFKKLGLWSEKYFFYFEDMDLCRQVKKHNKDVYFYPQAKVIHRHGASGKKLASNKDQWRRLIPGSKIYHGKIKHYLLNSVIWSGQKIRKIYSLFSTK